MTIIVHHLETSRSQRIVWLLEELAEPYALKRYLRDRSTFAAPPELQQLHPLGKVPMIQDGPTVIVESGAIFAHLLARSDQRLVGTDNRDEALRYTHFLHYADGSIMPQVVTLVVLGRMGDAAQKGADAVRSGLAYHLAWVESELASRSWVAGDRFTAADIMMSFPLETARSRAGLAWDYPHIDAWIARIQDRSAYQRALARAEPAVATAD
jgi:glutathione S-transferase